MKKIYQLLFALVLCAGANAQSLQDLNVPIQNDMVRGYADLTAAKTTTCAQDTALYPTYKATGFTSININNATSASAAGQYYNAPQPITLGGLEFYAYKIDATGGTSINVTVNVYLAGVDSLPSGAPLATASVAVDTNFGGGNLSVLQKIANFPPITVSAPYIVTVTNNSANGIGLIFNDYALNDGAAEWLCDLQIGSWLRGYDVNVGGTPFDADLVAHPIVTYSLTSDFTVANQCLTAGPTVSFTNASSPILFDRMYNVAATVGTPEVSCTWNYGDGSAEENVVDAFHVYGGTSANEYTATLIDTLFGWTMNCTDVSTALIGDSLDVNWTWNQVGSNVVFTDATYATSGFGAALWDFGDGNTSTMQNPNHTYATDGTYTVCLTFVSACGAVDSTCQTVTYTTCGNPGANFTFTGSNGVYSFTNTSATTGTATYAWDMGDGTNYTSTDVNHTYTANGSYDVVLVVTDSCGTNTIMQTVDVCLDPVASYTTTNNVPSFSFTNTSTTFGTVTYSWDMGDGTTYSTQDASHTYTSNGTFVVVLTVTDSCGIASYTDSVTVTGIGLNELNANRISVYPNPADEQFKVEADALIQQITVFDVNGREVYQFENGVDYVVVVNTSNWAGGQYTIQTKLSDGLKIHKKLVIAR